MIPETRYARTPDDIYIAYQVAGEGPVDVVWQFNFLGNVDLAWEEPLLRVLLPRWAAAGARLILHDRRGTGLSSRNVSPPDLETRVADLRVVLDAIGSERPVLFGVGEGGAPNVLFAASDPERVHSIVWWAPSARSTWTPDYPWGVRPDVDIDEREAQHWGTLEGARAWATGEAMLGSMPTEEEIYWHAKLARHTGTPDVGRELTRIWYETDIRALLPSVKLPTLLFAQESSPRDVEEAEYIASQMPLAEFRPMPGGLVTSSDVALAARDEFQRVIGVELPRLDLDTVLTTILFTDIAASTERQAALGDRAWKDLIQRHHVIVREALRRWRGVENDTAGDGFYATFDGPARAIRCALDVSQRIRELGIEIRAGVHTGECEVVDGKCTGIAVTIGKRVESTAAPSEVRVSQTVKDLVAGSGLRFENAGEHELKGVPDPWRLYTVVSA